MIIYKCFKKNQKNLIKHNNVFRDKHLYILRSHSNNLNITKEEYFMMILTSKIIETVVKILKRLFEKTLHFYNSS